MNTNPLTCFIENIPNKTFGLNICMGIRIRILLITNTYHLARVILLHRAFLFSTTKSEWEINLFIQAESEVEIVRFCLVVRCVFCIKEEEVEDKLCSNTWNSTFISPFKQMRFHLFLNIVTKLNINHKSRDFSFHFLRT